MESGAVASEVARAAGIHTSQLFRWRQQLCERAASAALVAVGEGADCYSSDGVGRGPALQVARAAGIHTSQLFRWRQQLCEREQFPAAFNSSS